jgi:hypothetical protein
MVESSGSYPMARCGISGAELLGLLPQSSIFLFMVYLTMLSVPQTIKHKMVR